MKKNRKISVLLGVLAIGMAGCSLTQSNDETKSEVKPYEQIAEVVSFDSPSDEILTHYTKKGIDMLRMGFPDKMQRDYVVTLIGKKAPDVTFTTLSGKEFSLLKQDGEQIILNISKTNTSVTEEMAPYLADLEKNHKELTIITMYPYDTIEDVEAFYDKQGIALDKDTVMVGEGSEKATTIVDAFKAEYVPSLFYIDESQTISYVAIGFRDAIYLEDYVDIAFGDEKFYDYISIPVDESDVESSSSTN